MSHRMNFKISDEMYNSLCQLAKSDGRSVGMQACFILKKHLGSVTKVLNLAVVPSKGGQPTVVKPPEFTRKDEERLAALDDKIYSTGGSSEENAEQLRLIDKQSIWRDWEDLERFSKDS